MAGLFEVAGNIHIHTLYSDGAKWHAGIAEDAIEAGLDFIVVTDHNVWVSGIEGYYSNGTGKVLLLTGEEIHDVRRKPQANHFLAYGTERELAPFASDPQELIDETRASGGHGFLAHPFDPEAPNFNEGSLGWRDWHVEGYAGLEIWNYMSSFKGHLTSWPKTIRAAFRPERYVDGPQEATLQKWDQLLAEGRRVAAIGSSDAHGLTYHLGPFSRVVFPYTFLFRAVNMHLLIREELIGDLEHDKTVLLQALGSGNGWVGYDLPQSTSGFRFSAQSRSRGIMGDEVKLDSGATLQVKAPAKCRIRLIHNGALVVEAENETQLTHIPIEAGAYRVECHFEYQGKERGWIYSNPVYLR
jgi:hypothetical protein